jgi:hypothetical protein
MAPLVALCASHLDSDQRVAYFRGLLKSYEKQTVSVPLFLSISVGPRCNASSVLAHALSLPGVTVLLSDQPASQFEHYKKLCDHLAAAPPLPGDFWVFFSDDDDLWDAHRAHYLSTSVRVYTESHPTVDAFSYPYFKKGTEVNMRTLSRGEYFNETVRFSVFSGFISACSPFLLGFRFCDVLFCQYAQPHSRPRHLCPPNPDKDHVCLYLQRYGGTTSHRHDAGKLIALDKLISWPSGTDEVIRTLGAMLPKPSLVYLFAHNLAFACIRGPGSASVERMRPICIEEPWFAKFYAALPSLFDVLLAKLLKEPPFQELLAPPSRA